MSVKRHTKGERLRRRALRDRLFKRQAGLCALCGAPMTHTTGPTRGVMLATFDHITPLALGGTHEESNLRLTHAGCNAVRQHLNLVGVPLVLHGR